MDYYSILAKTAEPLEISPQDTSYFSKPMAGLDPRLFRSGQLIPSVRNGILSMLYNYLRREFYSPESWAKAWLAGSGVSYHWAAQREPADLDCLVGVDYVQFRQANEFAAHLSDREIVEFLNEGFRRNLNQEDFMGEFELTFYANREANILNIKPYAAYSVTDDNWTVPPSDAEMPMQDDWEQVVQSDLEMARLIVDRYGQALEAIKTAPSDPHRRNAEAMLKAAVEQGAAMFDDIHEKRSEAFSNDGTGYYDFNNYRWQAGKRTGAVPVLKRMKQLQKKSKQEFSAETYGIDLPDASILIRRASTRPRPY